MNNDFLNQAMIAIPMSDKARGSGIMAGLMGGSDEMPRDRSPGDPEILMNNLRGDMRSVDARYMELAQMVGEEVAQETPPEVLALLQGQMAAPAAPGGIGALPGAPTPDQLPGGMAPPPPPPQAPGAAAQGPMPPPPGGGGIGPFSNSGAPAAPPTPDGLPPVKAAGGALISNAARWLRDLIPSGETAKEAARAADTVLGNQYMVPQPTPAILENVRGDKGRYTSQQYVTGGDLTQPTLTQGMRQGASELLDKLPSNIALPAGWTAAAALAALGAKPDSNSPTKEADDFQERLNRIPLQNEPIDQIPMYPPYSAENYTGLGQMGTENYMGPGGANQLMEGKDLAAPAAPSATSAASQLAALSQATTAPPPPVFAGEDTGTKKRSESIADMLTKASKASEKSRAERLKEETTANVSLYNELLGDGAKDRQLQALLLLAEAGFKFAGTARPTMAMALAESLSGVTKGMSALAAQKAEREQKIKLAALQSAESVITAQDKAAVAARADALKYARDLYRDDFKAQSELNLKRLDAQWKQFATVFETQAKGAEERKTELFKADLKKSEGPIHEDGGVGLIQLKNPTTKSFMGYAIDPSSAEVKTYLSNPLNLNEANPYVRNRGNTPQIAITDRAERVKAATRLNATSALIGKLDDAMQGVAGIYGPRAFISDFANNVLVPTVPLLQPNLDTAQNKTKVDSALKAVMKEVADNGDRLSNQQMQWVQEFLPKQATAFFQSPEVALKQLQTLRTNLINDRQNVAASLGFETRDLRSEVPALGTQNDPFSLPEDSAQRSKTLGWLANSLSNASPTGTIYVRMPNGAVQPWKVQDFLGNK